MHPEVHKIGGISCQVVKLLGHGKGGYSYLATDGQRKYTLKMIHHEPCGYYTFGDKLQSELRDYETLKKIGIPLPELLGVDRDNEYILKEYIDGPTVAELVASGRMKPEYFDQIREMCRVLYGAGINIDYYPTNFIVQDGKLFYIDYECNLYDPKWNFENWGIQYWLPESNPQGERT